MRSTVATRFVRADLPGYLQTEADDASAQCSGASQEIYMRAGFFQAMTERLIMVLRQTGQRTARQLAEESAELVDRVADDYFDDGRDFCSDWGPIVDERHLADWLARSWKDALHHGLPEALAYWLEDLLFEVVPPEAVAKKLADLTAEQCIQEVEISLSDLPEVA